MGAIKNIAACKYFIERFVYKVFLFDPEGI